MHLDDSSTPPKFQQLDNSRDDGILYLHRQFRKGSSKRLRLQLHHGRVSLQKGNTNRAHIGSALEVCSTVAVRPRQQPLWDHFICDGGEC